MLRASTRFVGRTDFRESESRLLGELAACCELQPVRRWHDGPHGDASRSHFGSGIWLLRGVYRIGGIGRFCCGVGARYIVDSGMCAR
jgi:hypothetical protein